MRQLRETGMVPAGLVACAGLVLLVGIRRHRRARRPVVVVNVGAVALCGGTVTVVGEASGQRGSGR